MGSGGSPEGAEALRLDSSFAWAYYAPQRLWRIWLRALPVPSGPLCFFLRTEKEEPTCTAKKQKCSPFRLRKKNLLPSLKKKVFAAYGSAPSPQTQFIIHHSSFLIGFFHA